MKAPLLTVLKFAGAAALAAFAVYIALDLLRTARICDRSRDPGFTTPNRSGLTFR